jgi:hypothetical protein
MTFSKEYKSISPAQLPFDIDEKIFCNADPETGELFSEERYSYNDFIKKIKSLSGINEALCESGNKI